MKTNYLYIILFVLFFSVPAYSQPNTGNKPFTVVSFPDFFNFDIPEPWPMWDTAVNWFFDQVNNENPEFILVAGDLVNGHWWDGPKCVEQMGANYYGNWKRRMASHGLKYYVAVGDHDIGDDPWPENKLSLVPDFERVFVQNMNMPKNGPENKKGLSYFVRQENVLFITVETFEIIDSAVHTSVSGEQLEWFKQVLKANQDADFIIVQGHVPVFGKPVARSSSSLMLEDSTSSDFWKAMTAAGVDLYLCGEFHAVTVNEKDGIWQIVHGSSWGRKIVNTMDYLVIQCDNNELILTMKSFPMEASGEHMWNLHKENGPLERVHIAEETMKTGPKVTGTLSIVKEDDEKSVKNISGVFAK